jgi:hypothetical protein
MWQLAIIGGIVDFLAQLGLPSIHASTIPLEYELVGEMVVVTLRDNIATAAQCQSVERELNRLINEHRCDFILNFLFAGRISKQFRGVIVKLTKAARKEARSLGKPDRLLALPHGELFQLFDDVDRAVEEMSRHGGHGWVVLCSVPVGIRAVFG